MRRVELVFGLLGVAACGPNIPTFVAGSDANTGDGNHPDAVGTHADTFVGQVCVGSNGFKVCPDSAPTMALSSPVTSTPTSNPRCAVNGGWSTGQPFSCIIAGTSIDIAQGVTVTVSGGRPLVLISTGDFTIAGTLDAASHVGPPARIGPASPSGLCVAGTPPPPDGGGAGGSFMSKGGSGGSEGGGGGGAGGQASVAETVAPVSLRPGCPGTAGDSPGIGGTPGGGGGAMFLAASGTFSISGTVDGSGGGGGGGLNSHGGGGGGGSGGMIALWGAPLAVTGTVIANGGGGGGAADGGASSGLAGGDPLAADTAAPGGTSGMQAPQIHGGAGSVASSGGNDGQNGGGGVGGTGGGGGAGYIQINKPLAGGHVSPPPKLVP